MRTALQEPYHIHLDQKIPEERREDWKQFLNKYPPEDNYQMMGRKPPPVIKHCHSCGFSYTEGKGICNDWFCSERCREWFDKGEPSHAQQQDIVRKSVDWVYPKKLKQRKERVVRKKSEHKEKLEDLSECLDCSPRRIKEDAIHGRRGKVHLNGDRIHVTADAKSKRKFSSLKKQLSFMDLDGHSFDTDTGYVGRWSMPETPTNEQAKAIRRVAGLKQSTISKDEQI